MGCDWSHDSLLEYVRHVNPRTHVGCDGGDRARKRLPSYFNPRTHVGCDAKPLGLYSFQCNFNPRTHVGCDGRGRRPLMACIISIHAPTWGATAYGCSRLSGCPFQSTHPRGVRRCRKLYKTVFRNFNPRTHVGCDLPPFHLHLADSNFNPRTHVGCDFVYCSQ